MNNIAVVEEVISAKDLHDALPKDCKNMKIPQASLDHVNKLVKDPEFRGYYREQLIGFANVLEKGSWSIEQYMNAVRYVSYKIMGCKNNEAFRRTFPEKMAEYLDRGYQENEINRYITAFNKSKLVNLLYEQSQVSAYILNYDVRQKAIDRLASLMMTANSEKVQADSATALLRELAPPEATKVELGIEIKETDGIAQLKATMAEMAKNQKSLIEGGKVTAKEIAEAEIIDPED